MQIGVLNCTKVCNHDYLDVGVENILICHHGKVGTCIHKQSSDNPLKGHIRYVKYSST